MYSCGVRGSSFVQGAAGYVETALPILLRASGPARLRARRLLARRCGLACQIGAPFRPCSVSSCWRRRGRCLGERSAEQRDLVRPHEHTAHARARALEIGHTADAAVVLALGLVEPARSGAVGRAARAWCRGRHSSLDTDPLATLERRGADEAHVAGAFAGHAHAPAD